MQTPANSPPVPPSAASNRPRYAWETCLDVEGATHTVYEAHFNPQFLQTFSHAPRVMLDIGCSTGNLGAEMKSRDAACRVIGIEPNRASAEVASGRLDRVFAGRFEEFDLEKEGIAPGSIDTVVAADVLEHMYDPWRVMVGLKRFLSPDAQVLLSLPNTRHIGLMAQFLDGGRWKYEEKGLLDITHIRFFTLKEIEEFLAQTGYRAEWVNFFLDRGLEKFFEENYNRPEINLRLGRISLERISKQEFTELCTWQFFIRARALP